MSYDWETLLPLFHDDDDDMASGGGTGTGTGTGGGGTGTGGGGGSNPPVLSISFAGFDDGVVSRAPIAANSVATTAQVNAVLADLGNSTPAFWLSFVLACADQGSSAFVLLVGEHSGIPFSRAANAVRKQCTLRQFCMAFAKLAFNAMVRNQRPPANWLRRGYTDANKYAAFDFFNGVTHAAAIMPADGLIRQPSMEEIQAANTNAFLAIGASRMRNVHTTNGQVNVHQQTLGGGNRPALGWS